MENRQKPPFCTSGGALLQQVVVILLLTASAAAYTEKVLYSFTGGSDGGRIFAGLVPDSVGNYYGATYGGGAFGRGTVYELSPVSGGGWTETVLYSFGTNANTQLPSFDQQGNLYGTTSVGGMYGGGTVYELSPASGGGWTETVLYDFKGGQDGAQPLAGLIFDGTGNLYGTTGWDWLSHPRVWNCIRWRACTAIMG